MNGQVKAQSLVDAVTIRVLVLEGKRLILQNRDGKPIGFESGKEVFGIEEVVDGTPVIHFVEENADISVRVLKERWERLIVDVWKRVGEQEEQELFQ